MHIYNVFVPKLTNISNLLIQCLKFFITTYFQLGKPDY